MLPAATPADVAEFLAKKVDEQPLSLLTAVAMIAKHFGEEFIGRRSHTIDKHVLRKFRKYEDIVWVERGKVWRKRREGDPPGRKAECL